MKFITITRLPSLDILGNATEVTINTDYILAVHKSKDGKMTEILYLIPYEHSIPVTISTFESVEDILDKLGKEVEE